MSIDIEEILDENTIEELIWLGSSDERNFHDYLKDFIGTLDHCGYMIVKHIDINSKELDTEEAECAHKYLDDLKIPRYSDDEIKFSLAGRIKNMIKKYSDEWTKDKIRNWLIDVYTLTDSSDKIERKEGIRQLMYLIDELKKEK